jgi:U6 snRNA-associated Sm-like protein LSm6
VKLNSGIEYRGVLACLDGYLNIAMEQTEEFENGQLKARYGDCMIRGNNGTRKANSLAFDLFTQPNETDRLSILHQLCTSPRRKPRNDRRSIREEFDTYLMGSNALSDFRPWVLSQIASSMYALRSGMTEALSARSRIECATMIPFIA